MEIEAWREDLPGPGPVKEAAGPWSLLAKASLRPPLVDAPVSMEWTLETGTPHGVILCRALGRTAAAEDIVLTIRLRGQVVRSPQWSASPLHEWWWQGQLEKVAKK